jgi:hypothetical protein
MKDIFDLFFITLIISIILVPIFLKLWNLTGPREKNYKGKKIAVGTGIILIIPIFIGIYLIQNKLILLKYFIYGIIFMGITGLIDDIWGDKNIKGLKGHFGKLKNGIVTTGILKAVIGTIVSFFYAQKFSFTFYELVVNFIIILLFINSLNLFDLRPGRCCKVFFILYGIAYMYMLFTAEYHQAQYMAVIPAAVIPFFIYDLKAVMMLGDAGSNILGFMLGFIYITIFPLYLKALLAVGLIMLHWLTEKKSLTDIINNNYILKYLDNLGRI